MAGEVRRILLTGATGFVGRQVARALAAQGACVRGVVRRGKSLPAGATEEVETGDLWSEDAGFWRTACEGVDTVIHAAWYVEPGLYLQSPKNLDCLAGTLRLAQGAVSAGVRRFAGLGTCFEYNMRVGPLGVDTPLKPETAYAGAKAAAFLALSRGLPPQGMSFLWCRLFYLYGEGEHAARLVPYLRARLAAGEPADLTSGTQVRDYLDVRVAGERIAAAALGMGEGATNICSGEGVTVRALAESIADEYGRRDLLRFGARPDNLTDPPLVIGVPGPAFG